LRERYAGLGSHGHKDVNLLPHPGSRHGTFEPSVGNGLKIGLLPVTKQQAAMSAHSNSTGPTGCRIKKVLLIEDEGEMCLLLNLILDNKELSINHVKSLSAAAAAIRKEKPDLILMDNRLPDGFGFDFIGYVKAHSPATKIIMISGVDKAAGDFALELGADLFLPKPFTRAALLQSVSQLLN
jgi:two-component system response regulator PilR (NtrC family)